MPQQPELRVEHGAFRRVSQLLEEHGFRHPVVVAGGNSLRGRDVWAAACSELRNTVGAFLEFSVQGEPSPQLVNNSVREIMQNTPRCDVVVAVGGGSVLDAGKAIAAGVALARRADAASDGGEFEITRYLEGVGDTAPDGTTVPLVAFPSTAGTGSEATMNAVLSSIGPDGFKKSLRHPAYVPHLAVLDTELHAGCPLDITRASGLDAVTQLLEAYLSPTANPIASALAELGLEQAGLAFAPLMEGEDTPELRAAMALAAYLSGVCLAAAGLGLVHGYASPIGALRSIPHGVVCGMLLAPVSRYTLRAADSRGSDNSTRARYSRAARLLGLGDTAEALLRQVELWARPLGRLSDYGFVSEDIPVIVAGTGLKNHPVKLDNELLVAILEETL